MKQRIARFSPHQTAMVAGALYGIMGLCFVPIIFLASAFAPDGTGMGFGLMLFLPVLYAVLGYVFTAIGCVVYNWLASLTGGIEFELRDAGQ